MKHPRSILTAAMALLLTVARAADPLVFISAFSPDDKAAIHSFQFDSRRGVLKPLHRTTGIHNPFFIAVSPNKRFLYAIDAKQFGGREDEAVAAYAIEGRSGRLTRLNQTSSRGTSSCYLDVDATGRTVLVANYSSGSVASLPVAKDGSLGAAASFMQHRGSSVNAERQEAAHAHSFVISPDNRFALAADLGIDKVMIYRLSPDSATLTPNEAQPSVNLAPGAGPRHITFHPNGRRVYVINELKDTVTFFDYAPATGTLSERQTIPTLPPDFAGKSYCADLKITPNGKYLYGTNRGHDSIACYRIGSDGKIGRAHV